MVDMTPSTTPTTAETFIASCKSYGMSETQINETLARNGITVQGGGVQQSNPPQVLDAAKVPTTLPNREALAMAAELQKHWSGAPEALEQGLKAAGIQLVNDADPRTEEEKGFDDAFGGPSSPEAYELDGLYVGRQGVPIENIAALDGELRQALASMSVPPALARGLCETWLDSANAYAQIKEGPARELWQHEQEVLLERIGHAPRAKLIELAGLAFSRIPQAIRENMYETGAVETAASILQLARQGERLLQREAMTKRRTA